jgi:hypothetical protein
LFTNVDAFLEDVKSNSRSGQEYFKDYIDYRGQTNRLSAFSFDFEILEEIVMFSLEQHNNSDILEEKKEVESKNSFYLFRGDNSDSESFLTIESVSTKSFENLNNVDLNLNFLSHKKNWLYAFAENFFAYSYDITYHIFQNYLYNEAPHLKYKKYWVGTLKYENFNFFTAMILDQIYALSIILLPFFNEFLRHFANSLEFSTFLETHPEYYLIFKDYSLNYYYSYFSNFYLSLYSLNITESFLTPVMILFQFFFIFLILLAFLMVYFNYYGSLSSEENLIDHDYLIFNVTVEAEEEIGSIDDMLLASVILLYIFLWFFWIYSWSSIGITPKLTMSIYLFPFIYYIIIFIPFSLLYDYGLYFLTYLNGVGKSSTLVVELMFDYIAVSIFYLRLIVQNVRLAFMLFTFIELHELVIFYNLDKNLFPVNESYVDSWDNSKTYFTNYNYYLLYTVPTLLLKWLYELFHTFFMVIFQFVAFFAMIFWLFLFLYTMFVSETQENYFTFKRGFRRDFFKNKINLKLKLVNN